MKEYSEDFRINCEICEIIGAFIGDGHLGNYGENKSQFVVAFTGHQELDKDYFENHLCKLIKENFPFITPRIYYRMDEKTMILRINSKKLYMLFSSLGFNPGKKSRTVKIPPVILNDEEFMKYTVRGIFDTDGCVFFDRRSTYKRPYPRITLQSSSKELINQLETFLSMHFKLYVQKNNRDGYRNYIEIYGNKQVETFLKVVGFSNKRHINRLKPPL